MQSYKDFAPTPFDAKGLNCARESICNFGVLLSQNRDSEALELSNFRVALERLGGESENVQVHRFGHWACGWFELLLVKPNTKQWQTALEIEDSLLDYPCLDEMDWSNLEWELNADAGMVLAENGEWIYPDNPC